MTLKFTLVANRVSRWGLGPSPLPFKSPAYLLSEYIGTIIKAKAIQILLLPVHLRQAGRQAGVLLLTYLQGSRIPKA
jgi:hypothetical protein